MRLSTVILNADGTLYVPPHATVTVAPLDDRETPWFVSDDAYVERPENLNDAWEWAFHTNREVSMGDYDDSDPLALWEATTCRALRVAAMSGPASPIASEDRALALTRRLAYLGGAL